MTSKIRVLQSIGRGLRSDCLGNNKKNKNKECSLILPLFVDKVKDVINIETIIFLFIVSMI